MVGTNESSVTSVEEVSVLPRHTKVQVTGNSRTKSSLIGLRGVVKNAVGTGGWHSLVLNDRTKEFEFEVNLQRNALTVIETMSGNEDDNDTVFENAIKNEPYMASNDIPDPHRSRSNGHESLGSVSRPHGCSVDLGKLPKATLQKYCEVFELAVDGSDPSKEQLLDVAQRHFKSMPEMRAEQVIDEIKQLAARRLETASK